MPKMSPHRASMLEQIPILRTSIIAELYIFLGLCDTQENVQGNKKKVMIKFGNS